MTATLKAAASLLYAFAAVTFFLLGLLLFALGNGRVSGTDSCELTADSCFPEENP
jgi:hypothetical protein